MVILAARSTEDMRSSGTIGRSCEAVHISRNLFLSEREVREVLFGHGDRASGKRQTNCRSTTGGSSSCVSITAAGPGVDKQGEA